ncbi:SBBP repeat-containing protein, partial [bacterium]|nr:SBBP repeat-containing protein [bacterium]
HAHDHADDLVLDPEGNVYVTGESYDPATGWDFTTIKYNNDGVQQWLTRYNGPTNGDDDARDMAIDELGNIYVTGGGDGIPGDNWTYDDVTLNYTTVKYNPDGIEQWVVRHNDAGNNACAQAITVDNTGNIYITGGSYGISTDADIATMSYNPNGELRWVNRYSGPINEWDIGNAIAVSPGGSVYVTGTSAGTGTSLDFFTIEYNSSGVEQWMDRYSSLPEFSNDEARAIAVDADGIYVTGYTNITGPPFSYGITSIATIKYSPGGGREWVAYHQGLVDDKNRASAIAIDNSGNVYIAGMAHSDEYSSADYCTIKYDSSGSTQWVAMYSGEEEWDDWAYALAVDDDGNVYVTGISHYNPWIPGFWPVVTSVNTIKYNASGEEQWVARHTAENATSIQVDQVSFPRSTSLEQNFPNPFNPTTTINYSIPAQSDVVVAVYDLSGRRVATLLNQKQRAGHYDIQWDGRDDAGNQVRTGMYFYRLDAETFSQTIKMIYLR